MRNISFSLTTPQVIARCKDVTRRIGWRELEAGERLWAVEKGRGLGAGEKVRRLGMIEIVSVTFEPLDRMADEVSPEALAYGKSETVREGFPEWTAHDFVGMFLRNHKGCELETVITRLEFRYVLD